MKAPLPRRRADLAVELVQSELMVLDPSSQELHCLSPLAAHVFRACDGARGASEVARELQVEHAVQDGEKVLEAALAELGEKRLLEGYQPSAGLSRRQVLAGLGLAVPFIATVLAPAPAMAASPTCAPSGNPCMGNKTCCSGHCNMNGNQGPAFTCQ